MATCSWIKHPGEEVASLPEHKVYGGQYGNESQMAYYAAFRKKYTGICDWQKKNESACLRNKRMKHVTGMHFYFPDCKLTRGEYNADWPSICNYPVKCSGPHR